MMEWTCEYRLMLIRAIIEMNEGIVGKWNVERIYYLSNKPAGWLENNLANFRDVITAVSGSEAKNV